MSNKVKLSNYLNQYDFGYIIKETGKEINFKPITTGQMKNLLVYEEESMATVEQVLDDIIMGCVTTEGFNVLDLTAQDRFSLLVEIRKKSKGNDYSFQVKCPKCSKVIQSGCNLDELRDIPIQEDIDRVVQLNDMLSLEMSYIRRSVQKRATDIVEKQAKAKRWNENQKMAEIVFLTYALSITKFVTPDGVYTQEDIDIDDAVNMLGNLPEATYQKINDWFTKSNYGVDFKYTVSCHSCDFSEEVDIPITHFFG